MSVPTVVMRARNDMPIISETLAMLNRQDLPHRLLVLDNGSTDGTREVARQFADRVIDVPAGAYVPGRVLNQAMAASEGEVVVFLNSDCTPRHETWLETLLAGMGDEDAAVFGRQVPRVHCHPLHARDIEATYGKGDQHSRWRNCFSMAASAIRRSVWEVSPFDERLRYSEDIDWTWRARQRGWRIRYVPDAVVAHSHDYSLRQYFRRQYGEGEAEAAIFDWSPWQRSFLRYVILPYGRQLLRDWTSCLRNGHLAAAAYAPLLRLAGVTGRWAGFRNGWREVEQLALRTARIP